MDITDEIQAQVLLPYVGQEVKIPDGSIHVLTGIHKHNDKWWFSFDGDANNYLKIQYCRLIIRPLSTITDEDAVELYESNSFPNLHRKANDEKLKEWGHNEEAIKKIKADTVRNCIKCIWQDIPLFLSDFSRSKGYDLPHHLLEGKTLYESHLAIHYSSIYVKE